MMVDTASCSYKGSSRHRRTKEAHCHRRRPGRGALYLRRTRIDSPPVSSGGRLVLQAYSDLPGSPT